MINNINIREFRNADFSQFFKHIISIIEKNDPQALQVAAEFSDLQFRFAEVESLFKVASGSELTKEMEELDRQRDQVLYGIQYLVKGFNCSRDAAVKMHAAHLFAHLSNFGPRIQQQNYHAESAIIRNIIDDWNEQPLLSEAVTALNLDSWKHDLENLNNLFEERFLKRSEAISAESRENMMTKRVAAANAYYELCKLLNAFEVTSKGAPAYVRVIEFINEVVNVSNAILSKRSGTTDEVTATEANNASEVK
jgi:hypothetical protein